MTTGRAVPPWGWMLATAGIALTVTLGFWQLGRAEYKRELQVRIDTMARQPALRLSGGETDAAGFLLHRVEVAGRFDAAKQVFLDNRVYQGRAGFHVVTPLNITGTSRYVLVNRGWIAATGNHRKSPPVDVPAGAITIRGTAVEGATRYIELSTKAAEGNIWQNLVLERYRVATGLDVLPFIVQQEAAGEKDGLVRDWPPADLRRNTNLAYAMQWFGMALAIFIYLLFLYVRSRRRSTT